MDKEYTPDISIDIVETPADEWQRYDHIILGKPIRELVPSEQQKLAELLTELHSLEVFVTMYIPEDSLYKLHPALQKAASSVRKISKHNHVSKIKHLNKFVG